MEITLANISDIPQLLPLLDELFSQEKEFKPDHAVQRSGLEMILGNSDIGEILVAKQADSIVGMVSLLYTVSTALGARVAVLEDMVVSKEARGEGVGSSLMEYALKHAELSGCKRITLLSDHDNSSAHRFYKQHGFKSSTMRPFRKLLVGKNSV